jgi:5-methylcytosine-specific restriction endonuclease McrA
MPLHRQTQEFDLWIKAFGGIAIALTYVASPAYAHTKRSQSAKIVFKHQHSCPVTGARTGRCKGYVIDHVKPLACGGADAPPNMQLQTTSESKAKDKWERKGCRK